MGETSYFRGQNKLIWNATEIPREIPCLSAEKGDRYPPRAHIINVSSEMSHNRHFHESTASAVN